MVYDDEEDEDLQELLTTLEAIAARRAKRKPSTAKNVPLTAELVKKICAAANARITLCGKLGPLLNAEHTRALRNGGLRTVGRIANLSTVAAQRVTSAHASNNL